MWSAGYVPGGIPCFGEDPGMAVAKEYTVIDLDGRHITALCAVSSPQRLTPKRWASLTVPTEVSIENPGAFGTWLGMQLSAAKFPRSRVIFTVSRSEVVLKPLTLPAGSTPLTQVDIANIVRLQMNKQLATHGAGAAIDYVSWGARGDGAPLGVLAGALPAAGLTLLRSIASAAGCKLTSIMLRCDGAAALLAEVSQRRGGCVLGVMLGGGSTEVLVVDDGQLVFARSLDSPSHTTGSTSDITQPTGGEIAGSGPLEVTAERLAVEVKRTWAGYLSSRGDTARPAQGLPSLALPELVAVIAPADAAKAVGERCSVMLGDVSWDLVVPPAFVDIPESMSDAERAQILPLLGAAAQAAFRRPHLNFARERKLPDPREKMRTLLLAGVLGVIVLGGIGYVLADQALSRYRTQLSESQARLEELTQDLRAYQVRHAKVSHASTWLGARVDWLGHVQRITDQLPAATEGVADELIGRSVSTTVYKSGKQKSEYLQGTWEQPAQILFDISGRVRSRQVASELRDDILKGSLYNVESQGPDTPDRYSFSLVTATASPLSQPAVEPPALPSGATKAPPKAPTKGTNKAPAKATTQTSVQPPLISPGQTPAQPATTAAALAAGPDVDLQASGQPQTPPAAPVEATTGGGT
jgi:hypothetical protein